jgi:AraC-like DNA-binding protein
VNPSGDLTCGLSRTNQAVADHTALGRVGLPEDVGLVIAGLLIGRDTVSRLAARGIRSIFTYRSNQTEAVAVVALTTEAGSPGIALQLDTGVASRFDEFVAHVQEALGTMGVERFDYLVNNAGISSTASFTAGTEAELDAQFAVHFKGVFYPAAEIGGDRTGCDDIDRDAARSQFERHISRECFDGGLHGAIDGPVGEGKSRKPGRDVGDPSSVVDQRKQLLRQQYTQRQTGTSPYVTAIDGVYILQSDHPTPPSFRLASPAMCIVAQGAKWATFGGSRLEYRAGQALVVGVEVPSLGRVFEARPDKPCVALIVELDLGTLRSVVEQMTRSPEAVAENGRGVLVTDLSGPLADCAVRLVHLLDTPDAIPTVAPLVIREMCYWLLAGPHGGEVARLALADSPFRRVMNAIRSLRERYAGPIHVDELASIAQLSRSAFHRQFKALTSLTPVQYQKQLRLLEARRLMLSQSMGVEAAAFAVGYESASQFSREYARMFGAPPKRDTQHGKTMLEAR